MTEAAPTRRFRPWLVTASAVALKVAALAAGARLFSIEVGPLAVVVAFTPWFTLVALAAVVLALFARSWILLAAGALVFALNLWWLAPLFTSSGGGEPTLTVATVNASYGAADAAEIVALVTEHGVDILAIQELTPELVETLADAGLGEALPFSVVQHEDDFTGTGLWSATEISRPQALDALTSWTIRGEVDTAHGTLTVCVVHPAAPRVSGQGKWSADLATLAELLDPIQGPVLVAGDFNTTRDHAGFRKLEAMGFVDESDQSGAGLQLTFPEGRLPTPLVAIDHVLVRDAPWIAVAASTVVIDGTDHRALIVDYSAR